MYIFELNILGINIAPTYYGLMYALGFIFGYLIIKKRGVISKNILDDLLLYIFLGVVLGGRLGYTLFYNFDYYINNIIDIAKLWEGGMSFHGGVIGVIIAMIIFSRRYKVDFYKLSDEVTAILPIGIGLGRIGNYINSELLGFSPYNGPLSVIVNGVGYFPSPLLEAILEGIVLFAILNIVYKKKRFNGQIASLFLIFYGIFRIFVEVFFRQPDIHIGYIMGYFTMGELLSLPMIIFGLIFYFKLKKSKTLEK